MNQKSVYSPIQVASFSQNHKKHTITLKTFDKKYDKTTVMLDNKKCILKVPKETTSAVFKANLTQNELVKVANFIQNGFK